MNEISQLIAVEENSKQSHLFCIVKVSLIAEAKVS